MTSSMGAHQVFPNDFVRAIEIQVGIKVRGITYGSNHIFTLSS